MSKGRCAECNAEARSKAFKSRPAGRDIPPPDECQLSFAFASPTNNKICEGCYQKNWRQLKRTRELHKEKKSGSTKRLRLDENLDSDIVLLSESDLPESVLEQEGIAVAALWILSQNASLK